MRPFLNTGIVVLLAAFLVICLFFDQPLELIAANAIITPIAFVAAAFANATDAGPECIATELAARGVIPLVANGIVDFCFELLLEILRTFSGQPLQTCTVTTKSEFTEK